MPRLYLHIYCFLGFIGFSLFAITEESAVAFLLSFRFNLDSVFLSTNVLSTGARGFLTIGYAKPIDLPIRVIYTRLLEQLFGGFIGLNFSKQYLISSRN